MKTFSTEATVLPNNKIILDHLPFVEGENVTVLVVKKKAAKAGTSNLQGSVLRYDSPFDPVDSDEWEASA